MTASQFLVADHLEMKRFTGEKFLAADCDHTSYTRPCSNAPPCLFITDSMNWHTYLLGPEISWGGGPEGGGGEMSGKKDHCSVSRGYMTSAQLLTKTQQAVPATQQTQ